MTGDRQTKWRVGEANVNRFVATERNVQLLAKPFDIATVGAMVGRLLARDD